MKKMISAEIVCICDQKPDFQQVGQVKTKASNKEVDMLTDLVEDVNPCEHWVGLIWNSIFLLC